jgi:anaphase-promoting complex subunit 1
LAHAEDNMLKVTRLSQRSAISVAPIHGTRENVQDLLLISPDHRLVLLTHGLRELSIGIQSAAQDDTVMEVDPELSRRSSIVEHGGVVSVQDAVLSSVTLYFADGWKARTAVNLVPRDTLTRQSMQILAMTLPGECSFDLHRTFLEIWSLEGLRSSDGVEFDCLAKAIYRIFGLENGREQSTAIIGDNTWGALSESSSHYRFYEDPVLKHLRLPPSPKRPADPRRPHKPQKLHKLLALVLCALHTLGENIRLVVHRYQCVLKLVPVICRIAIVIRPEWADYWKRLCPHAMVGWPSPMTAGQ